MEVASKAGCWAFKAFTAGLGVATIYLAATFSVNVYRGLSWHNAQSEYELDGIDWTTVDFEDNQECLDLFEKKPIGLISLLDEDSNFPKATDLTFANKLKQHLSGNPCFKGERGGAFGICHYAGELVSSERKVPNYMKQA